MVNTHNKLSKDGSPNVTDEKINTCTHLATAVFALVGSVFLIVKASVAVKVWHIVGFSIYGLSLLVMFLASTFHHGINSSMRIERMLKSFDYSAIFLLIAGTMTPICLTLMRSPLGWSLLGVAWLIAIIGIAIKISFPDIPKHITNTLYLTMGWLGIIIAVPVYRATGLRGLSFLLAGGVFYSIGAVIFAIEKPNPIPQKFGFHEIWHLFVIMGALCHFLFMYFIVLPT